MSVLQGGTLIVPGINSNPGELGIDVDGGVLQATADFTTAAPVTIGPGGAVFDTDIHKMTLTGPITGSGGLSKRGSGTMTLSGANGYLGGTTVLGGSLMVAHANSLTSGTSLTIGGGAVVLQSSLGQAIKLSGLTFGTGSGSSVTTSSISETAGAAVSLKQPPGVAVPVTAKAAASPTIPARIADAGTPAASEAEVARLHDAVLQPLDMAQSLRQSAVLALLGKRTSGKGPV